MAKRKKDRKRIGDGEICPKCARVMQRWGHTPAFIPQQPGRGYITASVQEQQLIFNHSAKYNMSTWLT